MPSVIGQDTIVSGFDPGLENPPITFGVWGDSGNGTGVIGSADGVGVTAFSTSGTALHARRRDISGTIIDARLATPALAGDFTGDVQISGTLAIGAPGGGPPVGQPAGELQARPGGGLELRVSDPADEIHLGRDGGSFAALSIAAERVVVRRDDGTPTLTFDTAAGNLGIGAATTPRTALHLPDRGLQIGTSTTAADNFHWTTDTVGGPRGLRLYRGDHGAGTHTLTVLSGTGRVGVNSPAPLARLHVSDGGGFGAEDGNGVLTTSNVPVVAQSDSTAIGVLNAQGRPAFALNIDFNGGTATARGIPTLYDRFDGTWHPAISLRNGRVGMGTSDPQGKLHVRDAGGFGAEDGNGVLTTSNVPVVAQSDSTAIGVLNAQGRPAFALNIDFNGGTATARGIPTLYDRFDGTWHPAISLRNGRVGMGTRDPQGQLHVRWASAAPTVYAENTSDGSGISGQAETGIGVDGASNTGNGVSGVSRRGGIGVFGFSSQGTGVVGWGATAGRFTGNVVVNGTLSKQSGQFKIDHPLDPANRYLCHSFVESSEMKNVYDGVVELDADGAAEVRLEDWCEALNERFRYQLTPIGGPAPGLHIAQEVSAGRFSIAGGEPGMRVSWQLTGVRHDPYALAHPLVVEADKPPVERGHYLSPDLYEQPADRSIEWAREPQAMRLLAAQIRRLNTTAHGDGPEE